MYTPSSAVALQGRVSIGRRPLLIRLYMHNIYNAMFISVLSAKGDLPGNSSALSLPYDLQAGSDVTEKGRRGEEEEEKGERRVSYSLLSFKNLQGESGENHSEDSDGHGHHHWRRHRRCASCCCRVIVRNEQWEQGWRMDAARSYDEAAIGLYGVKAKLNFPLSDYNVEQILQRQRINTESNVTAAAENQTKEEQYGSRETSTKDKRRKMEIGESK
ncbi:hypothetical protein LWI29_031017 [Acer saccharum]|uniref:AP2/ERF domain-containing protein n=1 Tax=Acer saccharum TaxID=4024 RepID=A0AA39VGV6_ACESA|nr:hypothetical protein LWI29_031017 [Acer saccharum]